MGPGDHRMITKELVLEWFTIYSNKYTNDEWPEVGIHELHSIKQVNKRISIMCARGPNNIYTCVWRDEILENYLYNGIHRAETLEELAEKVADEINLFYKQAGIKS